MKRITDYQVVVVAENISDTMRAFAKLDKLVVDAILDGWQPIGGPVVTRGNTRICVVQALVLYGGEL